MATRLSGPVWVRAGSTSYQVPGTVVSSSGGKVKIKLNDGKFIEADVRDVSEMTDNNPEGVEDMIQLSDLHEGALLENIRRRYNCERIYTYTGSILVAVNPYKLYDHYGMDYVRRYEGQLIGKLPAHIFAIGSMAFAQMMKSRSDQCVVISGESGAGKTESTKLIVQYLAAVNKGSSALVTEQILEASPILESFGNAKTVRNNNSSRFGKYLEVNFDQSGEIRGAKTTEYLLEKSRVCTQAEGERNYHVFYELCVGLNSEERKKFGLAVADDYFYLNQGKACTLPGKNDAEEFSRLTTAMEIMGFTASEKDSIFRILSSILHIGNLYFSRADGRGIEGCKIDSEDELQAIGALLGAPAESLRMSFTNKIRITRGEKFKTPLKIEQALDVRDALAKALYTRLFSLIVKRINDTVYKVEKTFSVAILDIFGFEDFKVNSFEQFCINYANENLQFYFNQHIFKLEQEEYEKEQISWEKISFNDNQPCLDLIAKRPVGLLNILDDESNFPNASDESFLDKTHQQHELNEYYVKPRVKNGQFGIRHYAGCVMYTVKVFLDKNRDSLRADLIHLMHDSSLKLVVKLFEPDWQLAIEAESGPPARSSAAGGRKKRTPTVSAKFHQSLNELIAAMSRCHPYFVRCLKPNKNQRPDEFDCDMILEQLRYSGMMETLRIRRAGYPTRLRFDVFVKRYRLLAAQLTKSEMERNPKRVCLRILSCLGKVHAEKYQMGRTKVFMREALEQVLEEERAIKLHGYTVTIQRFVRGMICRRRYRDMRNAAKTLQRVFRTRLLRRLFLKKRKSAVVIQSVWRMQRQRKIYLKMRDEYREKKRREEEERRRLAEEKRRQEEVKRRLEEQKRRQEEEKRKQEEERRRQAEEARREAERKRKEMEEKAKQTALEESERRQFEEAERKALERAQTLEEEATYLSSEAAALARQASTLGKEADVIGAMVNPQAADVTALDVPTDLKILLDKVGKGWRNPNSERGLHRPSRFEEVIHVQFEMEPLPGTLSDHIFSKYTGAFFREGHEYICHSQPLQRSLLPLSRANELEALAIHKLILRFCRDRLLPDQQLVIMANYIAQKGIMTSDLCDEILSQIACQLRNVNEEARYRGWLLMASCVAFFPPSAKMYKYLLNLVSVDCLERYKAFCMTSLRRMQATSAIRSYPATMLENRAIRQGVIMCLPFEFVDGHTVMLVVDSHVTAEKAGGILAHSRGCMKDAPGWTIALNRPGGTHELNGYECVLDLIAAMERPPGSQESLQPGLAIGNLIHSGVDNFQHSSLEVGSGRPPSIIQELLHAEDRLDSSPTIGFRSSMHLDQDTPQNDMLLPFNLEGIVRVPELPKVCTGDTLFDQLCTYNAPPWKLTLRKEMLHFNETLDSPLTNQLIFIQIVRDFFGKFCLRLTADDNKRLKELFSTHNITMHNVGNQTPAVKEKVLEVAKSFPIYFSRVFQIKGVSELCQNCTMCAVSHNGLSLLRHENDEIVIVDSYGLTDIHDFSANEHGFLRLVLRGIKQEFSTKQAVQVCDLIENILHSMENNAEYVLAVNDYQTQEETLLSFAAGDAIRLMSKAGMEEGWLFGEFDGRQGCFPAEVVIPIIGKPTKTAIKQAKLLIAKKKRRELEKRRKDYAKSHGKMVKFDSRTSLADDELHKGKHSMLEFARQYFRFGQERVDMERKLDSSLRGTIRSLRVKGKASEQVEKWNWQEYAILVKFTKSPIQVSLLKLDPKNTQLNKLAVECFITVMRFMGDYLLKGKLETDLVYFLLKTCHDHESLRDEVYCQLMKQTTTNKSTRRDSCARGWRLMMICTAYHGCSELLRPYLVRFLQITANDTKREFHAIASICEVNLKATLRLGGRKDPPGRLELQALAHGRHTKRQMFYLAGDITKVIKIKTCTIARDVIRELCTMMGLTSELDFDEYGLFADLGKQSMPLPLQPTDYILDITTMLERQRLEYWLFFKKIAWFQPVHLENTLLVDLLYHQVRPEIMRGYLLTLEDGFLDEKTQEKVGSLAALHHRVLGNDCLPKRGQVSKLLPPSVAHMAAPDEWMMSTHSEWNASASQLSPTEAKSKYLSIAMSLPLYGSSFFPIVSVSDHRVKGDAIMAINKSGVHFLSRKTREVLLTYSYGDIVSTRKLRADNGKQFIDLKCGNLMMVKVTRCETHFGREIGPLIALYSKLHLRQRRRVEEARGVFRADAAAAAY